MLRTALVFLMFMVAGCAALDKDNEVHEPTAIEAGVKAKLDLYRPLVAAQADAHGLMVMGGSIGDSALFSCLARVGGAASFDPAVLFKGGKPVRHPNIKPNEVPNAKGKHGTPISKDMVSGVLWCLYDLHRKGDTAHAKELVEGMISFGKDHKATFGNGLQLDGKLLFTESTAVTAIEIGWMFCSDEDRANYKIDNEDWYGRCFMPPAVIKDIYRIAKLVGADCDATCKEYMALGTNIPNDGEGFQRHLAVIGTTRNGFVEGAINDNSLKIVLQKAKDAEKRNALYHAAYNTFVGGDQTDAYAALSDESLFPKDKLPTGANYCTEYLFQRDEVVNGVPNDDWLPCPDETTSDGRGIEFVFAASLALGEVD